MTNYNLVLNYIRSISYISEDHKKFFMNERIYSKNRFYVDYIENIFRAFDVEQKVKEELTISFSLIYFSLLAFDAVYDEKDISRCWFATTIYREGCLISHHLNLEGEFWSNFRKLETIFFNSFRQEREISENRFHITLENYKELSRNKSIFYLFPIAYLKTTGADSAALSLLDRTIGDFHFALQIYDDYIDFKKDLKQNVRTFAHSELEINLNNKNINIESLSPEQCFAAYHTSGLAEAHLLHCSKILDEINSSNSIYLSFMNNYVETMKDKTRYSLDLIRSLK